MELLKEIALGIVLIPLFLWGLSFVLQLLLTGCGGVAALFALVSSDDGELASKEGATIGAGIGVLAMIFYHILGFCLAMILSFVSHSADVWLINIMNLYSFALLIVFIYALFNKKFAFAFSFYGVYNVLAVVLNYMF